MAIILDGTSGITTSSSLITGSGAIYNGIQASTVVASTSGTSITFTSIPSWVKRITLMFDGVSVSSTIVPLIRLGTSGTLETTGYAGTTWNHSSAAIVASATDTSGFNMANAVTAALQYQGLYTISKLTGNTWVINGYVGGNTVAGGGVGGSKTLAGALDTLGIVLTSTAFDNGSINILYE
jgi:hypothetical protein